MQLLEKNFNRKQLKAFIISTMQKPWRGRMKKYIANSFLTERNDENMEYNRIADIKRLQFIIDTLHKRLPRGATVLDVGCGNGIISRGIGKEGFNVYGIDVSEKAIEKAKALTQNQNVRFDVISAEQLVADGTRYD